uniref:Retrovirus-related Pol polyprotein from transposon TNT 1-94 n=1 Tax=Cajanus cajan TaxID=3821 RepID=A0A151R6M2_CAJCA|nr:Retrovirus-related Pol polyprotein from transposon TNT 1-94 [Cajanus cajan]
MEEKVEGAFVVNTKGKAQGNNRFGKKPFVLSLFYKLNYGGSHACFSKCSRKRLGHFSYSTLKLQEQNLESEEENLDDDADFPIRGIRDLAEIYERCNVAALEPKGYAKAAELEDRPTNQKVIGLKWVYRTKLNYDGSVNKLKARLVIKGYHQQQGVDFLDTFAPVARYDTIKMLVALATKLGWKIYHFDVKSAFLNGLLEEDIYVDQPKGFQVKGSENKVYKLHKGLYGLK